MSLRGVHASGTELVNLGEVIWISVRLRRRILGKDHDGLFLPLCLKLLESGNRSQHEHGGDIFWQSLVYFIVLCPQFCNCEHLIDGNDVDCGHNQVPLASKRSF